MLTQYIRDLQRQNQCPNYPQIRRIIVKLLENKGDSEPLGKHYVSHLISRHPQLKAARDRSMDNKRVSALNSTVIERFFSEFERLRSEYDVELQDIYNMDEGTHEPRLTLSVAWPGRDLTVHTWRPSEM